MSKFVKALHNGIRNLCRIVRVLSMASESLFLGEEGRTRRFPSPLEGFEFGEALHFERKRTEARCRFDFFFITSKT